MAPRHGWSSGRSHGVAVLGGRKRRGVGETNGVSVPWLGRPGDVALFGVCGEYNQSADGGGYRTRSAGGVGRNAQQAYEPDEYRECDHV